MSTFYGTYTIIECIYSRKILSKKKQMVLYYRQNIKNINIYTSAQNVHIA